MSAIALSWVATIKVGNQTAKQLLQFYASHNFNKPGFEFKIDTLVSQLETSKSSIQRAHKLLVEKNLIKKEIRYSKDGRQLPTSVFLNIPQEFVDNFFNGGGEGVTQTPRRVSHRHGEGVTQTPLNNNINNKHNKRESTERKKRVPLSDDFEFDDENQKLVASKRLDGKLVMDKFKASSRASAKKVVDWQAEAKLWIIRERPDNVDNIANLKNEMKSNVIEYGPGHPTWESNQEWKSKHSKGNLNGRDRVGCSNL